ncbi:MFS transporter [Natrarchaeobaculum sulfurireducens]|nr:MFS transporter [Natrarchaeobaculum sulfurireducens]AXR81215.1 hypothetical protein AArcMg_1199 [Natrarchaeobaculum sulfurireducens]
MSSHSAADDPFQKLVLSVGFLAVAASAFLARESPATGYELSIYTMTPMAVWAGLLFALAVALAVAFVPTASERSPVRSLAVGLGGLVVFTFASTPILRGYRYMGQHDALTHLGWARGISEGTVSPFDLFYPGIHTVSVLVSSVLEVPLERGLFVVVLVSMLVFWTFISLTVWTITESRVATIVAAFSAFLLLPVTTLSMYLTPHAMSQAVLFSALLCYLFVSYLRTDRDRAAVTGVGAAFAIAGIAAVIYHPQLLAHLIAAFVAVCVVQFLARRVSRAGPIADQTPMYGQVLFLIGLFLVWTANHGFFSDTISYFLASVVEFVRSGGGTPGGSAQTQGESVAAIGGSILELFFRLFTPQLVFSILAGLFGLAALFVTRSVWVRRVRPESVYFVAGLVALVPVFFMYFFASGSSMYFRVFGLMMVFITILGALAIAGIGARLSSAGSTDGSSGGADGSSSTSGGSREKPNGPIVGHPAFALVFALLLVLSLVAIFPSPYTYAPSPHVSETTMSGYETAFASQDEEVDYLGLRDGPNRFDDAVNGNEQRSHYHFNVDAATLRGDVSSEYDEDRYLVLTEMDYEREVSAYHGLRYTEGDLAAVESQPNVDRIQSNGEFDRYYVHDTSPDV